MASFNITQLRQAVYDHTFDVLNGLKTAGVTNALFKTYNRSQTTVV